MSICVDFLDLTYSSKIGSNTCPSVRTDPLLKWAGGKRSLLKYLLPMTKSPYVSYYEPFMGGGALFFALQPNHSVISDSNQDLMSCYRAVRDHPEEVINNLRLLPNTEADYYRIREGHPADKISAAARLIYLTTLSFNGLYRLNYKGEFNVPYGRKTNLNPCNENKIYMAASSLKKAKILTGDFEESTQYAQAGDLVYFDPPYTVAHNNNGFVKYNSKIFSWEDQVRLSRVAKRLVDRGCTVIVSNANHPSILSLYGGFNVEIVERASVIAASKDYRRSVSECIFSIGG